MEDSRLPKDIFYGELKEGSRKVEAPRLRHKDIFKRHLKITNEYDNWRRKAEGKQAAMDRQTGTSTTTYEGVTLVTGPSKQQLDYLVFEHATQALALPYVIVNMDRLLMMMMQLMICF